VNVATVSRSLGPGVLGPALLGVAALIVLVLPPIRRYWHGSGLVWPYLVTVAFTAAFLATPVVRAWALWRGVLDQPSARKVHTVSTPLLGGLAVYFAFALTVLFNFSFSRELKGVALGATVVVIVGIVDDVLDLPAWVKLGGQVAAAAIAMSWGDRKSVV